MQFGRHVLVIDDHDIFRHGLRALLSDCCPDVTVLEATAIEQVFEAPCPAPDLVLLDIRLPGLSGLDGIAPIKERWPDAVVAILSSLESTEAESEVLARGAAAFISKGEPGERILRRLQSLMEHSVGDASDPVPSPTPLTPRQHEVLTLLCRGLTNKLIARELKLSENTVRRHVQDILENFQVDSRMEAVFVARQRGLVA
jgi:DNA-binding NarL/FixJ family response regulator